MFDCVVKNEGGKLVLDAGFFSFEAPASVGDCLKPYVGKTVHLGIRPSDLEVAANGTIKAEVENIEPLGDAFLVNVRIGEKHYVFKHNGETAPAEKVLMLAPNMAKLHLFDPATQNRINA